MSLNHSFKGLKCFAFSPKSTKIKPRDETDRKAYLWSSMNYRDMARWIYYDSFFFLNRVRRFSRERFWWTESYAPMKISQNDTKLEPRTPRITIFLCYVSLVVCFYVATTSVPKKYTSLFWSNILKIDLLYCNILIVFLVLKLINWNPGD